MEFFRLPQFHLHGSKWSDWHLGSPSGSGVQIGTPEVRVGVDSQSIRVAISEVKDGRLTRMVTLKGSGVGIGAGIGLTVPFVNFSWSPKEVPGTKFNVPGAGSRIRYSAFSPDPMEPADFQGLCWVLSVDGQSLGTEGAETAIVFAAEPSLLSVSPTSLNALGVCAGMGLTTSLGGIGADVVVFRLQLE